MEKKMFFFKTLKQGFKKALTMMENCWNKH